MFTLSVFINRPPQEVFDLLINPVNLRQEMPLMQSAAWTFSGGLGVGSTGRGRMQMTGQETEILPKITQWDPPNRYGIKILNQQFPFESTEYLYTLEPEDDGTRITLDCESGWASLH